MAVVAFLPTSDALNPYINTVTLKNSPFVINPPKPGISWVANVAAQLSKTAEQLVLVFQGEQSIHAPAIGFSRRSLRRPAVGYILIDPTMPQIGGDYGDWPDAPVTVILTDQATDLAKEASLQAKLRGWEISNSVLETLNKY